LGYTLWYNEKYVDDIARAAAAGTSRQAATCSRTPRRATRRMPSVRSCSTRYAWSTRV